MKAPCHIVLCHFCAILGMSSINTLPAWHSLLVYTRRFCPSFNRIEYFSVLDVEQSPEFNAHCFHHVVSCVPHSGLLTGEMLWSISREILITAFLNICSSFTRSRAFLHRSNSLQLIVMDNNVLVCGRVLLTTSNFLSIPPSTSSFYLALSSHALLSRQCGLCKVLAATYWEIICQDEVFLSPDISVASSRLRFQRRILVD